MIKKLAPALCIRIAALLLLSVGCSDGGSVTDPVTKATPAPLVPAVPRPGRIYNDVTQLYQNSRTRYVLYDDGGFALQFSSHPAPGEYLGRYTTIVSGADTSVALDFDANDWAATAELRGNLLIVSYNESAQWADFIDGTYARAQNP